MAADQLITFNAPSVEGLQDTLNWATRLRHDPRQPTVVYQLCDTLIALAAYALMIEQHAIDRCGIEEVQGATVAA
jgi:hypothetical protein